MTQLPTERSEVIRPLFSYTIDDAMHYSNTSLEEITDVILRKKALSVTNIDKSDGTYIVDLVKFNAAAMR